MPELLAARRGCASTSARAEVCARVTRTSRVRAGSCSAATAAAYTCALLVQAGQRAQARRVALAAGRNFVHDPGSCSSRMVWPVGAVSNTMWSYWPTGAGSASSVVNSSNEAISVVHEPESCSVIAGELRLGQQAAHRADDPLPVGVGGLLRVDLQGPQAGHLRDRGDGVADGDAEDLPDVGGGVGADQQHPLALLGQVDGRGAGQRGLADAALAGEEQEPGAGSQETSRRGLAAAR